MRRDKAVCAQKYPVERPPNYLIISPPMSHHVEPYLLNPHVKDTIDSHLAAVGAETTRQYIALGWVGKYYSA